MAKENAWRHVSITLIAIAFSVTGCSDDPGGSAGSGGDGGSGGSAGVGGNGGSGGSLGPGPIGVVMGEEGSRLTLSRPDGTDEEIGGEVLFGWNNGQLLNGDYYKQIRVGTTIGAMALRMSFPGDAPPDGLIEGVHELRARRLLLEDTGDLDERQVEIYFQNSDPPFDPLTNATGTVEIFLDVESSLAIYDIAGEVNLTLIGDGGTHTITGVFWAREIEP